MYKVRSSSEAETLFEKRKNDILNAADEISFSGDSYYVSAEGSDDNDGMSPSSPWKTLSKVSESKLSRGDAVRFRRGDVFRGYVRTCPGVTYCAYGEGEKPKLYGWDKDLSGKGMWTLYDKENMIWKLNDAILDCGTLVFDHGALHSRKLIPSYINGKYVCRDDESKDFHMENEMTEDLDIFCRYTERMTESPSKGESFPVPVIDEKSFGELYLRCDKGDPSEVFSSIEALPKRNMIYVGGNENVTVDNLCLKYIGAHAIGAGGVSVKGLTVRNCEIGWIGGSVQHYLGTDPNYPQGGRGTVTRYGNGVEIYGGCDGYTVENCYIYQCYDAAITHQVTTDKTRFEMKNIRYRGNIVENCVYSVEYFLEKLNGERDSFIGDCVIEENILRLCGYGWGQQRHNKETPAHIKGWDYENTAEGSVIRNNIFDRSAYRMVHITAKSAESLPDIYDNVYIQTDGMSLGRFGSHDIGAWEFAFDRDGIKRFSKLTGETEGNFIIRV
ncbi:MAG: hypothetical protein E7665_04525 [Ruminococcaceae bacterium]|nr:hypothetical protein [Oscillospiraceae bacterium]